MFQSLYRYILNYDVFIPEENHYDDEMEDPVIVLQKQKYASRLYVLLLAICMYVLFYASMMRPQTRTIALTNIDLVKFEKLYSEHGELLSCPCSTVTTSYKTFVNHIIRFHPICSSFFLTQQWIEAMYLSDRNLYRTHDFRRIASSQVWMKMLNQMNMKNFFLIIF